MPLARVALHQTRLRTPGLSLDAKGVALGAKSLVLLPSLDRLVVFLAIYTTGTALTDLIRSLRIQIVKSQLGHHEVVMTFNSESSERMDRIAETVRLAGGYTFTGTGKHFVQYRDAAAPFGYDVKEITPSNSDLSLNHTQFSQNYDYDRQLELSTLLLQLQPRLAPSTREQPGKRWICTEAGLGPALIHYFMRSRVDADVGIAEWPPATAFEETPSRRYLFQLNAIPDRMMGLLSDTPGIEVFISTGTGSAVELGYEHPVQLRACPVFPEDGLVLIRGDGQSPLIIKQLPTLGPVSAFAQLLFHEEPQTAALAEADVPTINVPLRLVPDPRPWFDVRATLVQPQALGLLRQLSYRLSRGVLENTKIAFTEHGAFLIRNSGIDSIPIGEFFRQLHPNIFVSSGYQPVPAVAPDILHQALGTPSEYVFLLRNGTRIGIPAGGFIALDDALLDAQSWVGTTPEAIVHTLVAELPTVTLTSPGFPPLKDLPTEDPSS